jgi:hypothetical protein
MATGPGFDAGAFCNHLQTLVDGARFTTAALERVRIGHQVAVRTAAKIFSLEDTIMRATTIPLTVVSLCLTGLLSPSLAQPAQTAPAQGQTAPAQPAPTQPAPARVGPCAQIMAACKRAGFVRNGAKTGAGIMVDCIRPLMMGTPPQVQGTKPLPQIDPQLIAACKRRNPNFGTPGGANHFQI